MNGARLILTALTVVAIGLSLLSCEREERGFRVEPPSSARANSTTTLSDLQPGGRLPDATIENEYEKNAFALAEGKRLFTAYNCNGCHALGGGGMGPPLMDAEWRYGGRPEQVFSTIVEGRPNGMPSFRGRVPDYQVWQLAAYVRSLSGQVPKDAAPARADHLHGKPAENQTERKPLKNSTLPKSAEMPQ
jgi:cytochrome c oxidase cbb3-type subunit III